MAILHRNRPRLLRLAAGFSLGILLCVASAAVAATFLDAVVAGVAGSASVASDVAAARGLSLFGARPSDAPIRKGDAERLVDGRLIDQEAAQLAIGGNPHEAEEAVVLTFSDPRKTAPTG